MSANSTSKLTKEFKNQLTDFNSNCFNKPIPSSTTIANCSCNNISIMQLFHEMKQKFPTVPDNIVNECATENCHNREKCIAELEKELINHPITALSYPSQVIRNNASPLLKPVRPAPLSPSTSNSSTSSASNACDNNVIKPQISPKPQVKRPNTLDIVTKYSTVALHPSPSKPIRKAPPLPPNRNPHPIDNQSVITTSSIDDSSCSLTSPSDFSDSLHSSPTPPISEHVSCAKRLDDGKISSYVQFNPEPAYTQFMGKSISPTDPKSFTSVNFSLRPPSDHPQNPIEIHAQPDSGFSYSSVSFNPREGLKNQLQIHVNDKYGQFTISQIHQRTPPTTPHQSQIVPPGESVITAHIIRQNKQRDKLAKAVAIAEQKYKQVLEEIEYLESSYDPNEPGRLDTTIYQLRKEIQYISNLPDNSNSVDISGDPTLLPPHHFKKSSQDISCLNSQQQTSQSHYSFMQNSKNGSNDEDDTGPPWTCRSCTFQNHGLLQKCETCDTVRVLPGMFRITSSSQSDNGDGALSSSLVSFLTNNETPPITALHT